MPTDKLRVAFAFVLGALILLPIPLATAQPINLYSQPLTIHVPHIHLKERLKSLTSIKNMTIMVILNPNWTFVNLSAYVKALNTSEGSGKIIITRTGNCSYSFVTSFSGYSPILNTTVLNP